MAMTESETNAMIQKVVRVTVLETLAQLGYDNNNVRLKDAYKIYGRSVIDGLIKNGRLHPFKCSPKKVIIPKNEIELCIQNLKSS